MDEPTEEKAELDQEKSSPSAVFAGSTRRRGPWILLVLLLLGGVVAFYFFQRQTKRKGEAVKASPSPAAGSVTTAVAQKGSIGVYVNALGSVTPPYTVTVTSRVDGQLM